MRRFAQRSAFVLLLVIALSSLLCIGASAANLDSSIGAVTEKTAMYLSQIKEQFATIKDLVSTALKDSVCYVTLGMAVLLLLECFFSYRILKINTFVFGAYIGFAVGLLGFTHLTAVISIPDSTLSIIKWVVAGLIALIVGFLCTALNSVSVVIFAALFTFVRIVPATDNVIVQLITTAAVIVVGIIFFRPFFINFSSLISAYLGLNLLFSLGESSLPFAGIIAKINPCRFFSGAPVSGVLLGLALFIGFFGVLVQFKIYRNRKKKMLV